MKNKLISLLAIIIVLIAAFLYFNKAYAKLDAFLLVYPLNYKSEKIINDIRKLKKQGYKIVSSDVLKQKFKNKTKFNKKTLVIFINKKPDEILINFLHKTKTEVTFVIKSEDVDKVSKLKHLNYAFSPGFQKPKPKFLGNGYVNLNFDDGYESVYENALPILKKNKMSATLFAIPETYGEESLGYMSATQLRSLQNEGWEIGSHSYGHEDFSSIGQNKMKKSLSDSKNVLDDLSLSIKGFAFPFGEFNKNSLQLIKDYYYYFRFTNDTYNLSTQRAIDGFTWEDGFDVKWAREKLDFAKKNKVGVTFIFHEVKDNGRKYAIGLTEFKKVMNEVKKSDLKVYSNIALLGKPLYLRQENNGEIETEKNYINRLRSVIKRQKMKLKQAGINTDILVYEDGIVTSGLIKSVRKEGFKVGFGKRIGSINNASDLLDLKTIYVDNETISKLLKY